MRLNLERLLEITLILRPSGNALTGNPGPLQVNEPQKNEMHGGK